MKEKFISPITSNFSTPCITKRHLPHWLKEGSIYWVTFRLKGSIPASKSNIFKNDFETWRKNNPQPWNAEQQRNYNRNWGQRLEAWLDAGTGECFLRDAKVRDSVKRRILFFDGSRYDVLSFVIMPNHVHLLIHPKDGFSLSEIMNGIKGVSARESNKNLERTGQPFWQDESYDHIVRSTEQFLHYICYIADNPQKAKLKDNEFTIYFSEKIKEVLLHVAPVS